MTTFPASAASIITRSAAAAPTRSVSRAAPSFAITRPAKNAVPPSRPTAASETSSPSPISPVAGPMLPEFHEHAAANAT